MFARRNALSRFSVFRRRLRRRPAHVTAAASSLTLAVAFGGFACSLVQVSSGWPLRVQSRLRLYPLPPADWDVVWTDALVTAQTQQDAAFEQLSVVVLLLSAVGALIAMISFVALVLGAASARRSELATRAALGETPLELIRRLTLHALRLSAPALMAGVVLAAVAVWQVERTWPHEVVELALLEQMMRLLGSGAVIVLLGVVVSMLLAYLTVLRRPLAGALTAGARITASPGELRLRELLAIAQFAGVLTLLSGAGVLARESRPELRETTVTRDSLLVARLQLTGSELREAQARVRFVNALHRQVDTLPGVHAATLSSAGAWLGIGPVDRVLVECGKCFRAYMYMPYDAPLIRQFTVLPDFFDVLGLEIQEGRAFRREDALGSRLIAVVNRPLATMHFENEQPIGRQAQPYGLLMTAHEIVGIVPAAHAPVLGAAQPLDFGLYLPLLQYPPRTMDLLVRAYDAEVAEATLRTLRGQLAQGAMLHEPESADAVLRGLGAPLRFLATLLLAIATLVVLLGVHGAYALQRFLVANQQRALSIRLAVGCTPRALTRHVLLHSARLISFATLVGSFGALAAARGVQLLIPGAPAFVWGVFLTIALLLFAAALLGALFPARRAGRLQPAAVLD